jgi:hypothetical protein
VIDVDVRQRAGRGVVVEAVAGFYLRDRDVVEPDIVGGLMQGVVGVELNLVEPFAVGQKSFARLI